MIGIRKRDIKFAEKVSRKAFALSDSKQHSIDTPEKPLNKRFSPSGGNSPTGELSIEGSPDITEGQTINQEQGSPYPNTERLSACENSS